jgi:hypothetical protein
LSKILKFSFKNFSHFSKLLIFTIVKTIGYLQQFSQTINEFILLKQWGAQCALKVFYNLAPLFVPYSLLKKCEHVVCMCELNGSLFHIMCWNQHIEGTFKVMSIKQSIEIQTLGFGLHPQPIKKWLHTLYP